MKIGIMTFSVSSDCEKSKDPNEPLLGADLLQETAEKRGIKVTRLNYEDIVIKVGTENKIYLDGESLDELEDQDAFIIRAGFSGDPSVQKAFINALKSKSKVVINGGNSIAIAKNKIDTLLTLSEKGIPVTESYIVQNTKHIDEIIDEIKFPLILKLPFGSLGVGVLIAKDRETLNPMLDMLLSRDYSDPIMIQPYYKEAKNKDKRVWIINNEIIGVMQRTASKDDFRSNLYQGGSAQEAALTEEERTVALNAVKALNLNFAGVDLIETEEGTKVLEVNSNPFYKGIMEATGINIPDLLIDYAIKLVEQS